MRVRQLVHRSVALVALVAVLVLAPGLAGGPAGVAWAQPADPPDRVGRLNYLNGPVSFAPAGVHQWAHATLNYPLTTGSALWTDEGGRAELHVGSTVIRMDQMTELHLLDLGDHTTQIRVAQGTIDIGLRYLDPDEQFEIATPSASIALVRAGHYRVQVTENGALLTVRRGEAEVATFGQSFAVGTGQTAWVTETGYQLVANPALSEFDGWAFAREAHEVRAAQAAIQYVPPSMTGYEDLGRHGKWRVVNGYGAAWFPTVAPGWAPYRHGRWVWLAPWGWTWVDGAPWGFAPFHYGRWVLITGLWAWIPGPITVRPVFAPALVVFLVIGDVIGWFPLAPHEAYIPPYHASPRYRQRINITIININVTNVQHVRYVFRGSPFATTGVHKNTFLYAGPINKRLVAIPRTHVDGAEVIAGVPLQPTVHNVLGHPQDGTRTRKPPAAVEQRPVVVRRPPPAPSAPRIDGVVAPPRAVPVQPVGDRRPVITVPPAAPAPVVPAPRVTPGPQQIQPVAPPPPQSDGVPTPRLVRPGVAVNPPPLVGPTPQPAAPAPRVTPAPQRIQPVVPPTPQSDGVPTPRVIRPAPPEPANPGPQPAPRPPQPAPGPVLLPTPHPARPVDGAPPAQPVPAPQPTPVQIAPPRVTPPHIVPQPVAPQPVAPQPVAPAPQRDGRSVQPPGNRQGNHGRPVCDERSPYHDPRLCPQRKPGRR